VQDSEDEISHLEWETVKVKLVKAASLRQLVSSLACADTGELESTYVNIFLATYRTFATTDQVLDLLFER
jgi:ral guanine nucleotide dissociation stimulator-like 1